MARGNPAYVSAGLSAILLIIAYLISANTTVDANQIWRPVAVIAVGILLIGIYVQIMAPGSVSLQNESLQLKTHPTQRAAIFRLGIGLVVLSIALYLLYFTYYPYVYPFVTFVIGGYLTGSGIWSYWINSLTTYYVTQERVIKSYRLLSLKQSQIPMHMIRGTTIEKSVFEMLVGVGTVSVASGGNETLSISFRNVEGASGIADGIQQISNQYRN
jgi:uncharacterized membrane protein YdbT with pleckstrin-like domain